ncbi:MAG: BON domain-containing protein [Burkholderiales bacterium]
MKLLTVFAVAALAAGVYHYRRQLGRARDGRRGRSNEMLAEAVRSAVTEKASRRVHVRCVRGIVTLRGTLPAVERDRVLAAALAVPGVVQVTNFLELEESAERLRDEPVGDLGPMQSGIATGP